MYKKSSEISRNPNVAPKKNRWPIGLFLAFLALTLAAACAPVQATPDLDGTAHAHLETFVAELEVPATIIGPGTPLPTGLFEPSPTKRPPFKTTPSPIQATPSPTPTSPPHGALASGETTCVGRDDNEDPFLIDLEAIEDESGVELAHGIQILACQFSTPDNSWYGITGFPLGVTEVRMVKSNSGIPSVVYCAEPCEESVLTNWKHATLADSAIADFTHEIDQSIISWPINAGAITYSFSTPE